MQEKTIHIPFNRTYFLNKAARSLGVIEQQNDEALFYFNVNNYGCGSGSIFRRHQQPVSTR